MFMAFVAPGLALYRCKTELDFFSFAKGRKNHIQSGKMFFHFFLGNSPHDGSKKPLEFRGGLCFTFKSQREKTTQDEEPSM